MAFTLICHACGQKLTLFDIDVKRRKGSVRCTRCGARVSYDLDKRKIQQSGFWSEEESTFDPRVRERVVRQLERNAGRKEAPLPPKKAPEPSHAHDFGDNPFSAKPGFAHFEDGHGSHIGRRRFPFPGPHAKVAHGFCAEEGRKGRLCRFQERPSIGKTPHDQST